MYIFLAIISMVLLALGEVVSKDISNGGTKSITIFINSYLFMGIFRILMFVILFSVGFIFRLNMILLLLPNILISAAVAFLYLKAIKKLPISIVAPIYLVYYPISMIFSIGLLGETITMVQTIAMFIIGIIIVILSINSSKSRLNKGINKEHYEENSRKFGVHLGSITKGLIYVTVAGLLNGIVFVLDKNTFNIGLTKEEMILYGGIANVIIAFIAYNIAKKEYTLKKEKYHYTLSKKSIMNSGIKVIASICYIVSLSMGDATVVVPIIASSIVLVELLSSVLLKEKLKPYQYVLIGSFLMALIVIIT